MNQLSPSWCSIPGGLFWNTAPLQLLGTRNAVASHSFSLVPTPGCLYTGATPEVASDGAAGRWGAAPQCRAPGRCIPAGNRVDQPAELPASRQLGLKRAQAPREEPAELSWLTHTHNKSSSSSQGMLKVRKEFKTGKNKLEIEG